MSVTPTLILCLFSLNKIAVELQLSGNFVADRPDCQQKIFQKVTVLQLSIKLKYMLGLT